MWIRMFICIFEFFWNCLCVSVCIYFVYPENDLNKYADDSYLIVPSINSDLVPEELDHIAEWAKENNLNLNSS